MKKVKIELTPAQYQKLVESVFLGTWVANSTREDLNEEFEAVRDHVLSYYKEAGMEGLIEKNEEFGFNDLNVNYESELLHNYVEPYDEYTFWEKLAEKLADKELAKGHGAVSVPLTEEQILKKLGYEEEIEMDLHENGMKNVNWEKG
ncbi:hypothetical protein [Thalassobacillus pellis]|uniref:hypothetical protein n=1 Tax=Thalassobacillus pellis TaxID=748008 RepID=UPI001961A1FB|nr:hypothetical protein [Thalassobacillus pellis]MBM7551156.1 hypothetical protein [Thalassobacillus pellis]